MRLALFDLDHTLIDFDSGLAWTRFLVRHGRLAADAEEVYLGYARQYVAGTLDIHAMHRAGIAPLASQPLAVLLGWARDYEAEMAGRLRADMRELVRRHLAAGDLCAIVTATTRLVSEPYARLFGVPHIVATEAVEAGGFLTGEIHGLPCFREHKIARVGQWLAGIDAPPLDAFDESWFYSDSISDLPLMSTVTHPVAVRPDERLKAQAQAAGWAIL